LPHPDGRDSRCDNSNGTSAWGTLSGSGTESKRS
jgi:hypothetical protein